MASATAAPLTMTSTLQRAAALYGSRPAILDHDGCMSWSVYVDRIARAASVLESLGVRPGDRFAVLSRNSFRHSELINAGYWLGAVPVPVNHRLATPEIRAILDDAHCRLLAVEERFADRIEDDAFVPWHGHILYVGAGDSDVAWPCYEPLLAQAQPHPPCQVCPGDDALLLYTGGTTGRSKGVPLTHGNLVWNAIQFALTTRAYEEDRFLHVAPMFHSADLVGNAYTLAGGAHAYLGDVSGGNVLAAIREYRITVSMLAPTVLIMALQDPGLQGSALGSLRLLCYGSAPLAVPWVQRAMDQFPAVGLQQCYGLTETSPILTTLTPEQHRHAATCGDLRLLGSVGKPLLNVEIRIVNEEDRDVPAGESGEIAVRGPNVTRGYLGLPEQNAHSFRGGWFHTEDIGCMDEEGNLYIQDRKKDMIITGSENVYSSEVEAVLCRHPGVHEAAVIGVPDEKWGEAVFAVIVPAPGQAPTQDEIIEHCRGVIGGFKIPRRMAFADALPRSAVGKVLKHRLREMYGQNAHAGAGTGHRPAPVHGSQATVRAGETA